MNILIMILLFIWSSFKIWLYNIFIAPFKNLEVLWILIPVILGLILTEMFQEKKGTSRGNAISNSVIVLWGGIDFLRVTINAILKSQFDAQFLGKIIIALAIIGYGIIIIIIGLKGNNLIKIIGRVREVSYCIMIFAPLYYAKASITWTYMFGVFAYFIIFYIVLELIDEFIPDPKAFIDDAREAAGANMQNNAFR
jgi:hypothetical protein